MSQIRVVDASFQFYEHLLSIDLSDNIIEDIEDKSFAAQVPPQPHLPPPVVRSSWVLVNKSRQINQLILATPSFDGPIPRSHLLLPVV